MELSFDAHSVVLSKIYSIEDQISYCDAFKIPYFFNDCEELNFNPFMCGDNDIFDEHFLIYNNNNTCTIIEMCYINIVNVKILDNECIRHCYFGESIPTNITKKSDKIKSEKFNNNIVVIDDVNYLRKLWRYLFGAKKIYVKCFICNEIDNELRDIIIKLNVYGIMKTNNLLLMNDIGLFKIFLVYNETLSYRRVCISETEMQKIDNIDNIDNIVEHLIIKSIHNNNIILRNMPNLRILEIYFSSWFNMDENTELHTFTIHTVNVSKLKVIFNGKKNMKIKINIEDVIIRNFRLSYDLD